MPWHSAPQYPCCSLEVTFIFSTVKFDAEAAPGDEVSGFQHARTCSTLPLSALLSYPRGPHSPPLPSLLELGAGGLRGDGGGAAQPRAHLRPCRCLQRCCWGPAIPQLGALWPGFSSGATPCTCRHIFFCQQKSFQNFFSNYVENHISVCMFFARNVIYSQRDSCLTPPLWLRYYQITQKPECLVPVWLHSLYLNRFVCLFVDVFSWGQKGLIFVIFHLGFGPIH